MSSISVTISLPSEDSQISINSADSLNSSNVSSEPSRTSRVASKCFCVGFAFNTVMLVGLSISYEYLNHKFSKEPPDYIKYPLIGALIREYMFVVTYATWHCSEPSEASLQFWRSYSTSRADP